MTIFTITTRQQLMAIVGVLFVLLTAQSMYLVLPAYKSLSQANAELSQMRAKMASDDASDKITQTTLLIDQLNSTLDSVIVEHSGSYIEAEMSAKIRRLANLHGIEIHNLNASNGNQTADVQALTIELEIASSFTDLQSFLQTLKVDAPEFLLEDALVSRRSSSDPDNKGDLHISISASVYARNAK